MKVLMINVVCGIRSTGRICTDLAQALEAQGHTVKIAYGREKVPEQYQKYAVRIGTDLDVKIAGLEARLFDNAGFSNKKATENFIKWVKRYDPDVIHLHNIHGYYINIEILFNYLKTCGKKIIWTFHDMWPFTGHSGTCDLQKCYRWRRGCHNCPAKRDYPESWITDRSRENWRQKKGLFTGIPNMTIVTPSKWLAGLVKKSFLSEYPIEVIHNGIDTSVFKPLKNDFREQYHLKNKYIVLGVASAWGEGKGLSDFIKLAELLGDDYKIVLVGLAKEQMATLPSSILGIKRTNSPKELAYIYNASDLFVNLTYADNYPTVDLEAIACGTPILTYKTGGSTEIAEENNGFIVEQGNVEGAAEKIRELRKNGAKTPSLKKENTVDAVLNQYVNKYTTSENTWGGYWEAKQKLNLIGKYVILGVAAQWGKRKGLQDFIKLSGLLDKTCQIILVGVSVEEAKEVPDTIRIIKQTNSSEELRKIYSMADVFVNPTHQDNFPTTNIEALACGTSVITYQTGGSPEAADANTGRVVPEGDIQGLKSIIYTLRNKYLSIDDCTMRSGRFTREVMTEKYLELY